MNPDPPVTSTTPPGRMKRTLTPGDERRCRHSLAGADSPIRSTKISRRSHSPARTARVLADPDALHARAIVADRREGDLIMRIQVSFSGPGRPSCDMTAHLTSWIVAHGLLAVFVLMAIDAILPVGGELVMLFAGALAARHGPSLVAVVAAGTAGYLAGSLAGWAIGKAGGHPLIVRHGRWLHIGPERFARAERW